MTLEAKVFTTIAYLETTKGKAELEKLITSYDFQNAIARLVIATNRVYKWENVVYIRDKIVEFYQNQKL